MDTDGTIQQDCGNSGKEFLHRYTVVWWGCFNCAEVITIAARCTTPAADRGQEDVHCHTRELREEGRLHQPASSASACS
jgi:hypothetical protein